MYPFSGCVPPKQGTKSRENKTEDTGHKRPDVGETQRDTGTLVTGGPGVTATCQTHRAAGLAGGRSEGPQTAFNSKMTLTE